jgi:hypothetical protein
MYTSLLAGIPVAEMNLSMNRDFGSDFDLVSTTGTDPALRNDPAFSIMNYTRAGILSNLCNAEEEP